MVLHQTLATISVPPLYADYIVITAPW